MKYYFDNEENTLDFNTPYSLVFHNLDKALNDLKEGDTLVLWTIGDLDRINFKPDFNIMFENYMVFVNNKIILEFTLQPECNTVSILRNLAEHPEEDIALKHMRENYEDDEINWLSSLYAAANEKEQDFSFNKFEKAVFCEMCIACKEVCDDITFGNEYVFGFTGRRGFPDGIMLERDGSLESWQDDTVIKDPDKAMAYLVEHGYIWEKPYKLV